MADTRVVSLSDRGRRRNNEDFAAHFEPDNQDELDRSGCLYIIADGVGGAAKGERASQFAAQKLLYEYYRRADPDEPGERLREILEGINSDIHAYAAENRTRMATTIVAAVVRHGLLHLANVGDSRAYLIRNGEAKQLNRDHSLVGEMIAHGEMTEEEAAAAQIKNRLTRSLGGEDEVLVEVYPPRELEPGDKILLCTDGLTRYATRHDLQTMTAQGSLEEIAKGLVEYANGRGGADNITVVLVAYQSADIGKPTMPVARPERVDLDTLDTQPDLLQVRRKKKGQLGTIVTLGLLALVLCAAVVAVGGQELGYWELALAPPSPAPTMMTTPSFPAVSALSPSITPFLPGASPSPMSTGGALSPVPTGEQPPDPTPDAVSPGAPEGQIPAPTPASTGPGICFGRVLSDQPNLQAVLLKFMGREPYPYDALKSYYSCSNLAVGETACRDLAVIADHTKVTLGLYILMPGVAREVCDRSEGLWDPDGATYPPGYPPTETQPDDGSSPG